jgi:hypothetical protein
MTRTRGTLNVTKEEMVEGFARGRVLMQEEWAHPQEIEWVDELISEGIAEATPWEYLDTYQCQRRKITGVKKDA